MNTKNDIGKKKFSILHREIKKRFPHCNCEYLDSNIKTSIINADNFKESNEK